MNSDRDILRDMADRLFADHVDKRLLEAAEDGAWPAALWTALEANGLTQPLVPESAGGVGASWADAFVIVEAAGRYAAPVPLPETMLAGWLLARAGLPVPAGPLALAPTRMGETLQLAHDRLTGSVSGVPWGRHAGHLVAVAQSAAGPRLVLAAAGAWTTAADRNIAGEPRDRLVLADAPILASAPCDIALQHYGALMRSAQMAGALARSLDACIRYAQERVQFGRRIGQFQAIQHQLAELAAQAAQAALAAETAFAGADRGDPAFEAAVAKIVCGEAAGTANAIAHGVHGAIGFTYEHPLHFSTRRLWSWRTEFGAESHWAEALGRQAATRGADALWSDLTARQAAGSAA
ncbi:MAG: acyl-CoA dehydrogenase family protein [Alphaproteobacteria bacterium]